MLRRELYVMRCIAWRFCLVVLKACILLGVLYVIACIVYYGVYCMV